MANVELLKNRSRIATILKEAKNSIFWNEWKSRRYEKNEGERARCKKGRWHPAHSAVYIAVPASTRHHHCRFKTPRGGHVNILAMDRYRKGEIGDGRKERGRFVSERERERGICTKRGRVKCPDVVITIKKWTSRWKKPQGKKKSRLNKKKGLTFSKCSRSSCRSSIAVAMLPE